MYNMHHKKGQAINLNMFILTQNLYGMITQCITYTHYVAYKQQKKKTMPLHVPHVQYASEKKVG